MARNITDKTYRKEKCPICGELVGVQGLTNHIRKHSTDNQEAHQPDAKPIPRRIIEQAPINHNDYRRGYLEGFQDGQRTMLERFRLLGFLEHLTDEEVRRLLAA